jgi:hypothetical protein
MCHKLTPTQRLMLASEESSRRHKIEPDKEYYEWLWEDLIRYDLAMINREEMLREHPDFPKYIF